MVARCVICGNKVVLRGSQCERCFWEQWGLNYMVNEEEATEKENMYRKNYLLFKGKK